MLKYIMRLVAASTLGAAAASLLMALMITVAATASASAQVYPWCAEYSGGDTGGATNCGFVTLEQCKATISGIGGGCYENPSYPAASQRSRSKKK